MKREFDKPGKNRPRPSSGTERKSPAGPVKRKRRPVASPVSLPWENMHKFPEPVCHSMLEEMFARLPFPIEEIQSKMLLDYLLLVREQNEEINLVSRSDVNTTLLSSLFESIAVLQNNILSEANQTILDLGTGGGLPGIPLAIMRPMDEITLLDSRRVKTIALKRILGELNITNARVLHDRAETLHDHDEILYDIITVRAVGTLKEFLPWTTHLLKENGKILAWKGPEGLREMESLKHEWKLENRISILPHRGILVISRINQ